MREDTAVAQTIESAERVLCIVGMNRVVISDTACPMRDWCAFKVAMYKNSATMGRFVRGTKSEINSIRRIIMIRDDGARSAWLKHVAFDGAASLTQQPIV